MLILTEKPNVAKDFAKALNCSYNSSEKIYKSKDAKITIANCIGHLYNLAEPTDYDKKFKSWKILPIIPFSFKYNKNKSTKTVEAIVHNLLKQHKHDKIIIATDADREGEVIARECLLHANITDLSNIKRFWVSQALTPEVIKQGLQDAAPLSEFNTLADQGFGRQKADWLIGMNVTRFISNANGNLFPVGRVQTAILSEINNRCKQISNFKKERYFTFEGIFTDSQNNMTLKGIYIENQTDKFQNTMPYKALQTACGKKAKVTDKKIEEKIIYPPSLYNLNELQKAAFKKYGYTAEETLSIIQTLYEKYKCVSYPRTPSKVMGSKNIDLCYSIFQKFSRSNMTLKEIFDRADFTVNNKHIFNDSKLETHHALIPLDFIPENATNHEKNIFELILKRFMLAFAPVCKITISEILLNVGNNLFKIKGTNYIEKGWKKYEENESTNQKDESDILPPVIDWKDLTLTSVQCNERFTKPPEYYNEASILSFMENPKNNETRSLIGLGTSATRHTFIPKLLKNKLIEKKGKDILITETGNKLLAALKHSAFNSLADIRETTRWEEELSKDPKMFLTEITNYIKIGIEDTA